MVLVYGISLSVEFNKEDLSMMDRNNQQTCQQSQGSPCGKGKEQTCCVSVNKIFDSAKDKDCLEDLRVHLCDCAQEVVDRATAVRCTDVEVL